MGSAEWKKLYRASLRIVRVIDPSLPPSFMSARSLFTAGVAGAALDMPSWFDHIRRTDAALTSLQSTSEVEQQLLGRIIVIQTLTSWLLGTSAHSDSLHKAIHVLAQQVDAGAPTSLAALLLRCAVELRSVESFRLITRRHPSVWEALVCSHEGQLLEKACAELEQSDRLSDEWCALALKTASDSIGWHDPDAIELEGMVQYARIADPKVRSAQLAVKALVRRP